MKKYQLVERDEDLASLTANMIDGRPDIWDHVATYATEAEARTALARHRRHGFAVRILGKTTPFLFAEDLLARS